MKHFLKRLYIRLLRAIRGPKDLWISDWKTPPPLTPEEEEHSQQILDRIMTKIRSDQLQ